MGDGRGQDYGKAAGRLIRAFHPVFWDEKRQLYASFRRRGLLSHYAQFTQALAINEGVTRAAGRVRQLRQRILTDEVLVKAELPSKYFVYTALLDGGRRYAAAVLDDMRQRFGGMLAVGATSLWEAADGAEAFERAGSLCHAWSSVFNAVAGAYVLGVRPIEPGFERFTVAPLVGGLAGAEGVVPTPKGAIRVAWQDDGDRLRLKLRHPKALEPVLTLPPGKKVKLL